MAVLVQEAWADHFNPTLITVVDGVIVALVWKCDRSKHFAFFFCLDAHAEATRIHQLQQATRWAKKFPVQTSWSSLGIGILFALILKGGVVRRQCGVHPYG